MEHQGTHKREQMGKLFGKAHLPYKWRPKTC